MSQFTLRLENKHDEIIDRIIEEQKCKGKTGAIKHLIENYSGNNEIVTISISSKVTGGISISQIKNKEKGD